MKKYNSIYYDIKNWLSIILVGFTLSLILVFPVLQKIDKLNQIGKIIIAIPILFLFIELFKIVVILISYPKYEKVSVVKILKEKKICNNYYWFSFLSVYYFHIVSDKYNIVVRGIYFTRFFTQKKTLTILKSIITKKTSIVNKDLFIIGFVKIVFLYLMNLSFLWMLTRFWS